MRLIGALVGSVFVSACVACTGGGPRADIDTSAAGEPLTGTYLGQRPPGMEPQLFASGVVSTG